MATYPTGHVRASNKDHLIALAQRRHRFMAGPVTPLPPAWDSVSQGWVGAIKDQAQCGSCWDFSGTGMIEIAYNKAGLGPIVLSEEYTLSCCRNGGCNGDDNVTVLEWAKKTGLPTTADYGPYAGRPQQCAFRNSMTLYKVNDWGFCDNAGGNGVAPVDTIKAAIMQHGSAGSAIAADDAFMNIRPGTVFHGSGSRDINHDIILVGWDDTKGAWILRNSWGTSWVDGGYCWIAYGANQVGTEAVWCQVDNINPPVDVPWLIAP